VLPVVAALDRRIAYLARDLDVLLLLFASWQVELQAGREEFLLAPVVC
jgi:hypothetical protein